MSKYDLYKYYDIMLRKLSHSKASLYVSEVGDIKKIGDLQKQLYREYDTRVILSGKNMVITKYNHIGCVRKYDINTGQIIKVYPYDTRNMKDKYLRTIYANQNDLSTFVTLTFSELTKFEDVTKAYKAWLKNTKSTHKDMKYIKIFEKGKAKNKKVHLHLLVSIGIEDSIFKRANTDNKNQYNVTNWDYGFSLAYRVNGSTDFRKIAFYLVKDFNREVFPGKRNMSKSNSLNKPKVFYYHSKVDQRKINTFIKKVELVNTSKYNDFFGSSIESNEYMLID